MRADGCRQGWGLGRGLGYLRGVRSSLPFAADFAQKVCAAAALLAEGLAVAHPIVSCTIRPRHLL